MVTLAKRIAQQWLRSKAQKTAGGMGFEDYIRGTNADRAFNDAQAEGRAESGSRGYSGTIAEKPGYRFLQNETVTQSQAREIIQNAPFNDKWGDAFALKIGEETVVATKKTTVKVKARNMREAREAAKQLVRSKAKVRKGAELVVESEGNPDLIRPGGLPEMDKTKGTEGGFSIGRYKDIYTKNHFYRTKKEAVKALKNALEDSRKGEKWSIWKVAQQDVFTVTGEPTKLASWDVPVSITQVKVGKPTGFIFWGVASS